MSEPSPEVLFHRNVRDKHPRGWADLDNPEVLIRHSLSADEVSVLLIVRDSLNLALANAKITPLHYMCGPWHFDYIDADAADAQSFCGDGYSFIGITLRMAKDISRASSKLRSSGAVWQAVRLNPQVNDAGWFQLLAMLLALLFIGSHEYCHHVLGHQPYTIPDGDPRTASLRGNLQTQTREIAADGYAAMHLLEHVIAGEFRSQMIERLRLQDCTDTVRDQILFLFLLMSVAATWYRHPPSVLDAEGVYLLTHPPRAARLNALMEHAMLWCRGFRANLIGVVDGQYFANFMYVIGVAVCDNPADADSRQQHAFMRSPEGREYSKQLFRSLYIHKSLMGS